MSTAAEHIAAFLLEEGHRPQIDDIDPENGVTAVHFRARGRTFTVAVSQRDPHFFSVSSAYELPDWARDETQSAPVLVELQSIYKSIKFFYTENGGAIVAAVEQISSDVDEFCSQFWRLVSIVRDGANAALERIIDHSETKAAADKFINDFMSGRGGN